MSVLMASLRRALQIGRAFLDIGFSTAANYPISLLMSAVRPVIPVLTFFFVARLVTSGSSVGGDYYTFVVIGFVVTEVLAGALGGFTQEMQSAVQQGRFEMLLTEPVRWHLLPFGLAAWPILSQTAYACIAAAFALLLGFRIQWTSLPAALGLLVLAIGACLSLGIISGGIGAISKRSDPVLTLYSLVAGILSGVAFPIELLPPGVRLLSWVVPHTYVITGIRKLLLPNGDSIQGPTVFQAVVALLAFNLVMYPVAMWGYGKLMEAGRRTGVLSGY